MLILAKDNRLHNVTCTNIALWSTTNYLFLYFCTSINNQNYIAYAKTLRNFYRPYHRHLTLSTRLAIKL